MTMIGDQAAGQIDEHSFAFAQPPHGRLFYLRTSAGARLTMADKARKSKLNLRSFEIQHDMATSR